MFAILLGEEVIGEIQLKRLDMNQKVGTLSIQLSHDDVKGKGYGTEAEQLIINHGFQTLGLRKILADTVPQNNRSKHILKKLGFRHTHDDDKLNYFELRREDWLAVNEEL